MYRSIQSIGMSLAPSSPNQIDHQTTTRGLLSGHKLSKVVKQVRTGSNIDKM